MNLFEKIEAQKTLSPATQNIEGTEGTEGTSPKSLGKRGDKNQAQEGTEGTEGTNATIILQSDEDALFFYLLSDMQSGGAYARLWPNIKRYCQRTLDPQQFSKLLTAYEAKEMNE